MLLALVRFVGGVYDKLRSLLLFVVLRGSGRRSGRSVFTTRCCADGGIDVIFHDRLVGAEGVDVVQRREVFVDDRGGFFMPFDKTNVRRGVFPIDGRDVDLFVGVRRNDSTCRAVLCREFDRGVLERLAVGALLGERDLVDDLPESILDEEEVPGLSFATQRQQRFFVAVRVFAFEGRGIEGHGQGAEVDAAAAEDAFFFRDGQVELLHFDARRRRLVDGLVLDVEHLIDRRVGFFDRHAPAQIRG